ncbi:MAG: hypothetical protein WBC44_14890 [Planctomycetaceae bacterium]
MPIRWPITFTPVLAISSTPPLSAAERRPRITDSAAAGRFDLPAAEIAAWLPTSA